ncbi:Hok/Gef family protein [Rouxiella chamberiensis]|uniref:Hok/Gef family protein n=2 Tax=Rouxiella chamberiensis TaxID=1513468 RepID=A0ABY7HRG1_9GAMM|nr:Hok/Gef family protein [Rouxiella chamberiensis]WAT01984.1 Hok/Gef family protein [Rouxiella chamberiensis]
MPHKLIFAVVTIICLTLLMFTLLTRPSLCEVQYKSGVTEVAAYLACNVVR